MPAIDRSFPPERLREAREWLGLTREKLARDILGVGVTTVVEFEAAGAPAWVRYTLLCYAVLVHGATPRAAARRLELPWEHFPLPRGSRSSRRRPAHRPEVVR